MLFSGHQAEKWGKMCLYMAVCSVLLGRGMQHLIVDPPYWEFFWYEKYFGWFVRLCGLSWGEYLEDKTYQHWIASYITVTGVFMLGLSLWIGASYWYRPLGSGRGGKVLQWLLLGVVLQFLLLYFSVWIELFLTLGGLLEQAAQFLAPVALIVHLRGGRWVSLLAKIALAFTFIGHGLYAVGFYAIPASFMQMTVSVLGITEGDAVAFLKVAGIVDFIVIDLIFIPNKWAQRVGLGYMICWGLLTSLARPFLLINPAHLGSGSLVGLYEFLYRGPHFLLPAFLFARTFGRNFGQALLPRQQPAHG